MPSGFPGPIRTLADLFSSGAQFLAERLYKGARSVPRLIEAFRNRYGTNYQATNQTAGTLGARAQSAVEAGRRITAGLSVDPLSIPINNSPLMAGSFHYDSIVIHRLPNPINPAQPQEVRERISISSPTAITSDEIQDIVEGVTRDRGRELTSPEILNIIRAAGIDTSVEFYGVISAYRGLGTR